MSQSSVPARVAPILGALLVVIGLAVFGVRFQHPGPYGFPAGGNLIGGLLALGLGALLLFRALSPALRAVAFLASPLALFLALYATMAELEEVVVVKATNQSGDAIDLRLWVIDHEGAPWVTMPRSKADEHSLGEGPVQWLRNGEMHCILPERHEDRESTNRMHRLRARKYAVQRIAASVGLFGEDAAETVIALKMGPCR